MMPYFVTIRGNTGKHATENFLVTESYVKLFNTILSVGIGPKDMRPYFNTIGGNINICNLQFKKDVDVKWRQICVKSFIN